MGLSPFTNKERGWVGEGGSEMRTCRTRPPFSVSLSLPPSGRKNERERF